MTHTTWDYESYLRERGYRVTSQRRTIMDAICSGAHHSTFEEILTRVRRRDSSIDQATVYRTLAFFVEEGLVAKFSVIMLPLVARLLNMGQNGRYPFTGKNHFYRANRELGRVFKTEFILQFLSDPTTRQRVRRGLLKGEEIHALARQVAYGKQGMLTARDLEGQRNTSSCLTLIMACIIYWQAKEINRFLLEEDPDGAGVDLSLLKHISPIGWENIILYGEYVLNRSLVRA